ncbi:toxin-antitoxin system YwqK family antitoxin [Streptomyces noursei]
MLVTEEDIDLGDGSLVYYQGEPFTGEVVTHGEEGRMINLVSHVEGFESDLQAEWHPDGTKMEESTCWLGVAVGEWRTWRPNGQLAEFSALGSEGNHLRRQRWGKEGNLTVDKRYTP